MLGSFIGVLGTFALCIELYGGFNAGNSFSSKTKLQIVQRMVTEELEGLPASFYGLEIHGDTNGQKTVTWYPVMFPRCAPILNQIKGKELQEPSQGFTVDIDKVRVIITLS